MLRSPVKFSPVFIKRALRFHSKQKNMKRPELIRWEKHKYPRLNLTEKT